MKKKTIKIAEKISNQIVKECVSNVLSETVTSAYFDSYEGFSSFLKDTDDTMEYYYVSKEKSNLSVDLYIDDCSSYKRHNHPLWIYFCDGYSHNDELVPISISDSPQIMIENYTTNLPPVEISRITQFIKDNQNIIKDIADERINSIEFVNSIKHSSQKMCVEKVNTNINEMPKLNFKDSMQSEFPPNAYRIWVQGDNSSHKPAYIHINSFLEGWTIRILIESGELCSVVNYGKRVRNDQFADIVKLVKLWFSKPTCMPGRVGTNQEAALNEWEACN